MNIAYQPFITCAILSACSSLLVASEAYKSVLNITDTDFIERYKKQSYDMCQNEAHLKYDSDEIPKILSLFIGQAQTVRDIETYRIACTWKFGGNKCSQAMSYITQWHKQIKSQQEKPQSCKNNHIISYATLLDSCHTK